MIIDVDLPYVIVDCLHCHCVWTDLSLLNLYYCYYNIEYSTHPSLVGLVVGSWPSNRATEGSNPKGTRLYFVILLKNVEKSLIGTDITV